MAHLYGVTCRARVWFSLASFLAGCANPDSRLVADEASCRSMGHARDTPPYAECLKDLNNRRCAVAARKGWTPQHVASVDCTRIN